MWLEETNWKELTQGRVAAPHSDICSTKTQENTDKAAEIEFVENAEPVAGEDLPEELEHF